LGVYEAPPAPNRVFPITFQDGEIVYPGVYAMLVPNAHLIVLRRIRLPSRMLACLDIGGSPTREQRKNIIPIYAAALLAALVPVLCFAVFQIRKRSFQSFSTATMGVLISLITAALFQVFLKWLIGGLRPVSKPVILCHTNLPVPALSRRLQAECHGARNRVPPDLL
jgi:diacylglycerol diphosphate phosphatase/phosphatidate phosphatase